MATFAQYEELVKSGKIDPNAPSHESSTIDTLANQLIGSYDALIFYILVVLIALYALKRYRMIDKIKSMENKTITKIVIILSIFWIANSFLDNYSSSYDENEFNVKRFLKDQIIPVIVYGYLWITNKLTLK